MSEEWRPIPGIDGAFASSLGRIRGRSGKVLAPWLVTEGRYLALRMSPSRGLPYKNWMVHRLVLSAFDRPPRDGEEVAHNNGRSLDNRPENLRWDTRSGNLRDKVRHGTHNKGSRHNIAKLTEDQVMQIRNEYVPRVVTIDALAKKYGVSRSNIHVIVARKGWHHV